jgi:hypothetical protein
MRPVERRVLDLSVRVMEETGGLDIHSSLAVRKLAELEREWGAAVRELIAEREKPGVSMDPTAKLREVAEAATPGPWYAEHHGPVSCIDAAPRYPDPSASDPVGEVATEADATHVATFDPPTVLALIDVVALAEHWAEGLPPEVQQALDRLREVSS